MKPFFTILAAVFAIALTSCSALQPNEGPKPVVEVNDLHTGAPETYPAVLPLADGQFALLYDNKDDRVTFQIGESKILLDQTAPVHGGNWFQLHQHNGRIYASWWSHENAKNLYITSSTDGGKTFGPVAIVNDNHGVLPPYTLSFGDNGVVTATYSDERTPKYEVYFNRSTDHGLTWQRPDVRLDEMPPGAEISMALEPHTLQIGQTLYTFWDDSNAIMQGYAIHRVLMRTSSDLGKTWSPVQEVFRSTAQISSLQVLAAGQTLAVVFDDYQHGIKALVSPDAGKSWLAASTLTGTSTTVNSGIALATDGKYVYAVWNSQQQGRKTQIGNGRLALSTGQWTGPATRLDTKQFNNTDSGLPTISAFDQGAVVAAWVDYRDIRPNIYVSLTSDQGVSWSKPEPIAAPGLKNLGLPRLVNTGSSLALSIETFPSDLPLAGSFSLVDLDVTQSSKALPVYVKPEIYSEEQKQKLLTERVNELWKLRMAGNYDKTYDFFDFQFRAFMPKKDFVEKSGNINYFHYEIVKSTIDGNVADVEQKITYDSKPIMLPNGNMVDVKKSTQEVKGTWVWVGDNWYLVYAPSFGKPYLYY